MFERILRVLLAEPALWIALVPLGCLLILGFVVLLTIDPFRGWSATKLLALINALLITRALIKKPSLPRFSLLRLRRKKQVAPQAHIQSSPPPKKSGVAAPPPNLELRRQQIIIDNLVVEAARQAGGHRTLGWLKKYLADSGIPESRVPYFRQLLIDRGVPLREDAQASPDAEPAQSAQPQVVAALPPPSAPEPAPAPSPPVEQPAPKPERQVKPAPAPLTQEEEFYLELRNNLREVLEAALRDNLSIRAATLEAYGYETDQARAILKFLKENQLILNSGLLPPRSGADAVNRILRDVKANFRMPP